jgi:hypothetical protein
MREVQKHTGIRIRNTASHKTPGSPPTPSQFSNGQSFINSFPSNMNACSFIVLDTVPGWWTFCLHIRHFLNSVIIGLNRFFFIVRNLFSPTFLQTRTKFLRFRKIKRIFQTKNKFYPIQTLLRIHNILLRIKNTDSKKRKKDGLGMRNQACKQRYFSGIWYPAYDTYAHRSNSYHLAPYLSIFNHPYIPAPIVSYVARPCLPGVWCDHL